MTDQPGYDPAEDPDADPDQLNPRSGAAAGRSGPGETEHSASTPRTTGDEVDQGYDPDADPDADPDSINPRTENPRTEHPRTDDAARPES